METLQSLKEKLDRLKSITNPELKVKIEIYNTEQLIKSIEKKK